MHNVIEIQNASTRLLVDAQGLRLHDPAGFATIAGGLRPLWEIVLQEPSYPWAVGKRRSTNSLRSAARVEPVAAGQRLVFVVADETRTYPIRLTLEAVAQGEGFELALTVKNDDPELTVREVSLCGIGGIAAHADSALLWPEGLGRRFANLGGKPLSLSQPYPSGLAGMQWLAVARAAGGLYLGCHDPRTQIKRFTAACQDTAGGLDLGVTWSALCAPGTAWSSAPVVLSPYRGAWQAAAHLYRRWFDDAMTISPRPEWTRRSTGQILAILKQQNGDVMWDYRTGIDELCDLAEARGLDTLGLFGWAHGGHDYLYPDYIPDPLMGGEAALRAALARARQRGIRTYVYANGICFDTSTDYYRYQGNDAIALTEDAFPYLCAIRKFHSASPVTFAFSCSGAPAWRERMLALALQAHRLGADGILYDQVGCTPGFLCFNPAHGHATPATAAAEERSRMIRDIAAHMRQIAPDFAVMTEGINDALLDGIAYVHGWGAGFAAAQPAAGKQNMFDSDSGFPEMFRVTFPEIPMTQRHPSPMLDRNAANYACVHGLRHEIETRWRADVNYLRHGVIPAADDYADCAYWPPDPELMSHESPESTANYLRRLAEFRRMRAEFLLDARPDVAGGWSVADEALVARGYRAGDRVGVVVWNPTDEPRVCDLHDAGALESCEEPEAGAVKRESPVPPRSLRLYVFHSPQEASGKAGSRAQQKGNL